VNRLSLLDITNVKVQKHIWKLV